MGCQDVGALRSTSEVSWIGSEAALWAEWLERFEKLCHYEDHRIREVGRVAKSYVAKRHERALREEQQEAIYGWAQE